MYLSGEDDVDLVEKQLFLSSLQPTLNKRTLQKYKITHIISVIDEEQPAFPNDFTYMTIPAIDSEETNLLGHFPDAVKFIEDAISSGGNVLVHCLAGVSRSATIVLAYMMKKYDMAPTSALKVLRTRRRIVSPNDGFLNQLELWAEFGYTADLKDAGFRRFMMEVTASVMTDNLDAWNMGEMVLAPDPAAQSRHGALATRQRVLRCKMCRRVLATRDHIVDHPRGPGPVSFARSSRKDMDLLRVQQSSGSTAAHPPCSMVFIEAMEWISHIRDGHLKGTLQCPNHKCGAKLGSWSWSGSQCSCGAWLSPAFGLHLSKVDLITAAI
ncbi:hypothetical protein SmJEL517_g01701 [Synchytrium microbalum]|uniref:protein-tyrosine-phosphatase n=1 Tax=Synchytrium microbalum TaxID=1806994 RepID=A0A507CDE7_9FUNG|nr:uncharacterized protein SmJEL517_g01701 [Synchytrium microbalum]TPX35944.1 hypothetical protein SmJEL517_g01701 [Synchytrium microbalum]